jgi:hypothetical protein
LEAGAVVHAYNPRTWEAEAGGLRPTWATDLSQKGFFKKGNNGNINLYTLAEKSIQYFLLNILNMIKARVTLEEK